MGRLSYGMSNQTSEAFAYIEREYNDVKGRVEVQRSVVEQLHMVEADTGEAEAALNALLDDEASKLTLRPCAIALQRCAELRRDL
jgi:hypothetical protein